jgi:hypothetical protein
MTAAAKRGYSAVFTTEVLVFVALRAPADLACGSFGLPISHWTGFYLTNSTSLLD